MRRRVMISHLKIHGVILLQRRHPSVHKLAAELSTQHPAIAVVDHPVRLVICVCCCTIDKWNRDPRRKWAESGINDKCPIGQPYREKHVRSRRRRDGSEQDDARCMTERLKPKFLEYGGKKRRMLEAITAALGMYELGLNTSEIETYTTTQQYVEVLEWDEQQMRTQ